jgi:hypothetical protein
MVTVQDPVPVHAPLQPVKVDVPSGTAVKVTTVPELYVSVQSRPQTIPAGLEVTVPPPVPALPTVNSGEPTAVVTVELLLLRFGSASFPVTETVLVSGPGAVGVTTIVTTAAVLPRVPRLQVTVLEPTQLP